MGAAGDFKFGHLVGDEDVPYRYPDVWATEQTKGPDRLILAPGDGQVDLMLALTDALPEPFAVLYVLLVPRTEERAGRYQSPLLGRTAMKEFMRGFRDLFERDGRHHVWVTSLREDLSPLVTLVYDQHDVVYAYGPLPGSPAVLLRRGLTRVDAVRFPVPHSHHYNPSWDEEAERLLSYWGWVWSPLRPEDEW